MPITLTGHEAAVYALLPYRDVLLSGGGDGWVVAWRPGDSATGAVVAKIDDRVVSMCAADDRLAVGTLSGDLYWLTPRISAVGGRGAPTRDVEPRRWRFHADGLFGLATVGEYLFATGGGGRISRWRIADGEMDAAAALDTVRLRSVAWLPLPRLLAVGTANGDVHLVDPNSLRAVHTIPQAHELTVFSFAVGSGSFFSAGRDGAIRRWSQLSPFRQLGHVAAHATTVNALALAPDARVLASAGRDREARLWAGVGEVHGAAAGELRLAKVLVARRDGGHEASVNACRWWGADLATAGDDRTVKVWARATAWA